MSQPRTRAGRTHGGAWLVPLLIGCSGTITAPPDGSSPRATTAGAGSGTPASVGAPSTGGSSALSGAGGGTSVATTGGLPSGGTSGVAAGDETVSGTVDPTDQECATQTGAALKIGRSRLSRLTRTQIDHTIRDLLGVTGNLSASIAPDESVGPFASNALAVVTDLVVQQHQELAAKVALDARARMAQIAPCDLSSGAACVREFITTLGTRAYRRPLKDEEIAAYEALYGIGGTPENGFRLIVEAMLQSPFFLYHADVGPAETPSETPVVLTSYELASRLSYFLWDSMPDQTLFDLAASDALDDDTTLTDQVTRMLADPRAKDAIPLFQLQWLDISPTQLGSLASTQPDLMNAMIAEAADFANNVVLNGDGLMSTLFTASFSYPRGDLFSIYGMTQPPGFVEGSQVALDPTQRAGLLTQPGFLVKHYRGDEEGSVVHRGITVRENILCTEIQPPPPDVMATPLPPVQGTTARDRFAAHEVGACAGCHTQMDPIGLAFENYDGLGRYRTMDGGVIIDASGEVVGSGDELAGAFDGPIELGQKLANSRTVADCLANQWFRFALARIESLDDACSLKSLHDGFAASGYNIRQLITTLVLSDAFRHVRTVGAQETQ